MCLLLVFVFFYLGGQWPGILRKFEVSLCWNERTSHLFLYWTFLLSSFAKPLFLIVHFSHPFTHRDFFLELTLYFPFLPFVSIQWRMLSYTSCLPTMTSVSGFELQHRNSFLYASHVIWKRCICVNLDHTPAFQTASSTATRTGSPSQSPRRLSRELNRRTKGLWEIFGAVLLFSL